MLDSWITAHRQERRVGWTYKVASFTVTISQSLAAVPRWVAGLQHIARRDGQVGCTKLPPSLPQFPKVCPPCHAGLQHIARIDGQVGFTRLPPSPSQFPKVWPPYHAGLQHIARRDGQVGFTRLPPSPSQFPKVWPPCHAGLQHIARRDGQSHETPRHVRWRHVWNPVCNRMRTTE
ncbi:hypothetical protein J6590_039209 [Homalodisca vitripennis]|nr:hypothetical protein J6590_039209 [Homalodisca vitripennis]